MIIITGGQSGADLGGNRFAEKHGIQNCINTHIGFKPVYGEIPYGIKVNIVSQKRGREGLNERTRYNVMQSDATLILVSGDVIHSPGSNLTFTTCQLYRKPRKILNYQKESGEVAAFLKAEHVRILNIAGQRDLDEDLVIAYLEREILWQLTQ